MFMYNMICFLGKSNLKRDVAIKGIIIMIDIIHSDLKWVCLVLSFIFIWKTIEIIIEIAKAMKLKHIK